MGGWRAFGWGWMHSQDQFRAASTEYFRTMMFFIFKQGDGQYDVLRHGFNKRIDKYPLSLRFAKTQMGLWRRLIMPGQINSRLPLKSGGHCMEGLSCSNGGMVIDLSLLNTFSWKDNDHITAGPALRLIDLYKNCLPKGKIVPGGSCQSVALGGLTLGGGYGLLSRQFGLTCDSLSAIKMVDGSGNIISSVNDSELLWACKGGANGNFGIITEMNFKVHKAPSNMQSYRLRYNEYS
jgi:FAD/FMN-containing dehydrogenase